LVRKFLTTMNVFTVLNGCKDKQGFDSIIFKIRLNGKTFKISSGIKVPPESFSSGVIKSIPGFSTGSKLNTLLHLKQGIIEESIDAAKFEKAPLTPEYIKMRFKKLTGKEKSEPKREGPTFTDLVDLFVEKHKNIHSPNYLRMFDQPKNHLLEFRPDIDLPDFTEDLWVDYVDYLVSEKGLSNATINAHLRKIKRILAWARKRGHEVPADFIDITYSIESKQPFWCTWNEVIAIKGAYCRTFAEEVIRDSFFVSANMGIRNSDFNMINKHSVYFNNGNPMLRIVVVKTQLDYSIPINKDVWEILQKYNMNIPKYRQSTFNEYIKIIAQRVVSKEMYKKTDYSGSKRIEKLIPRHKMFTTHTARRTFGRRWLDKGGSLIILQKIFGHSAPDTTLKYIGYNSFEIENEFSKVMG
jgi:integrase